MSARSCVPFLMAGLLLSSLAAAACKVEVGPPDEDPPANPPTNETKTGNGTPPPTPTTNVEPEAPTLYYGACLTELALDQASKVINFYATARKTADNITLAVQPLATENNAPPAHVGATGVVGAKAEASSKIEGGSFVLNLGTITVPATANPISGADLVIANASLSGTLSCGFLSGDITAPTDAARKLDSTKNVCRFTTVKEGDPTPVLSAGAFKCVN